MSGPSPRPVPGGRYRLAVAAALGLVLALAGGASKAGEDQQLLVRLAAIAAIAATLWPLDFEPLRRRWPLLLGAAAVYLLVLLQLLPLPPALWAALPGRGVYAQAAQAAGSVGWRPLSLTPDLTLNALFALLPATAMILAVLYLDPRGRMRLVQGVVAVACVSSLLGLIQLASDGALHLFRETSPDAPIGLFANRNHQAAFLACALPLIGAAAGLRLREGARRQPVVGVALAAVALVLPALIWTGSRMGLLLGAAGLIGAALSWRAAGQALLPRRGSARLGLGGLLLAVTAAVGFAAWRGGAVERLAATDTVSETRAAMLAPLTAMAQAFLPFGSGFGSFDSVYRHFEPQALLSTIYMNQAHNEPLQVLIEGGLPALALLLAFCVWWARAAAASLGKGASARRRVLGIAFTTIGVIVMASSLVDYPLRTPLLSALFALACVELSGSTARRPLADARRSRSSTGLQFADWQGGLKAAQPSE